MSALTFAGIALFGALGAVARAFSMDMLKKVMPVDFPWSTMIVNIVACFLIGAINGHNLFPDIQAILCTGFLGGFSTMSTLNDDALNLLRGRRLLRFAGYMVGTYACCLLACLLGFNCL